VTKIHDVGRRYHRFFQQLTPDERATLARAKRFVESWLALPALRRQVATVARDGGSFDAVRVEYGIEIDPAEMAPFLGIADVAPGSVPAPPAVQLWLDYRGHLSALRQQATQAGDTGGTNPAFDRWRQRQIGRTNGALGETARSMTHPVIAFELSDGCSVGCWFCGISANRFAGHWPYRQHAPEWRDILRQTVGFFGPAAGTGFCYWATDPSDNPDYADFVNDFAAVTGVTPVTTTAAPLRNTAMIRRVMRLAEHRQGLPNRFSILTPRQLKDVFRTFSPDELLHVELVLHMPGSIQPKSIAGRARTQLGKRDMPRFSDQATIACVSGFLVNLPRRHIRLVTPVPSSDQRPDGFRILGERDFTDATSFGSALHELADRHMFQNLGRDDRLRLQPDIICETTEDGFALTHGTVRHTVRGGVASHLGRILLDGNQTVGDASADSGGGVRSFLDMAQTIESLFDAGVLQEPDECSSPAVADAALAAA
jgi:radical SAM family RiPP maturation amino acid epimerase